MQRLIVSVTYEKFLPFDSDTDEVSDTGFLVKDEKVNFEDIAHFASLHGFNAARASDAHQKVRLSSLDKGQEYFEHGIEKLYSLHIQKVDGKQPSAEQIRIIANAIFATVLTPQKNQYRNK